MANFDDDEDELEKEATGDDGPESDDTGDADVPESKGEIPDDVDDDSLAPNQESKAKSSPVEEDPDTEEELDDADAIGEDLASKSKPLSHKPTSSPESDQMNRFKQYMEDYKRLQQQQRKGDLVNGLIAAGGKIGQSIAGRTSGNFVPDPAGNAMLAKMNDRPVQQFEQAQIVNGRGMQLQAENNSMDPASPQSRLVRDYVEKRLGLKLDDNVSAADAQMLLKTVGRPTQTKFQKVNGSAPQQDGSMKRMSAIFDPGQGVYIDPETRQVIPGFMSEGLNPYQVVTDPKTGLKSTFNKSSGGAMNSIQGVQDANKAQTAQDVYASMTPVVRKEFDEKIVPNFNKLTEKTQQRMMHQAPIMAKLQEAQLNPAAYAQLQAELARFDVGDQRLAQQEFNMFATRHGYKGWGDWIQKNSTGTISDDFAQDFAHTINNTIKGMQSDLNGQAEKQAQLLINRLPPGQRPDPKLVAPLIYSGYKPVKVNQELSPQGEIERKTKDGRIAIFDSNKKFLRYKDEDEGQ